VSDLSVAFIFHPKFGCILARDLHPGPMFEIHSGPADQSAEIETRLRERLAGRALDPAEIQRVADLSMAAHGTYGFDPQETCELFERPVPPPDFRSWKYRYIRGPLRPVARWIYGLLQEIVERMSENRVQAFNNAVYEIVELRRENEALRRRLAALEPGSPPSRPAPQAGRGTARSAQNIPRPL
jgi:hypothetical protein